MSTILLLDLQSKNAGIAFLNFKSLFFKQYHLNMNGKFAMLSFDLLIIVLSSAHIRHKIIDYM